MICSVKHHSIKYRHNKSYRIGSLILLIILFCAIGIFCGRHETNAILKFNRILKTFSQIKSYSVDFVVYGIPGNDLFDVVRGRRLYWRGKYYEKAIMSKSGKKATIETVYDGNTKWERATFAPKKVFRTSMRTIREGGGMNSLDDLLKVVDEKSLKVTSAQYDKCKAYLVNALISKNKRMFYEMAYRLKLYFSDQRYPLRWILEEQSGKIIAEYVFHDISLDPKCPFNKSLFSFSPAKDIEIIDKTQIELKRERDIMLYK